MLYVKNMRENNSYFRIMRDPSSEDHASSRPLLKRNRLRAESKLDSHKGDDKLRNVMSAAPVDLKKEEK
jgi:hypothetical protein